MRNFFRLNKLKLGFSAVLFILTVLMCVPAVNKVFTGVFGYAVYFYLVLCYVFSILSYFRMKLKISRRQTGFVIAAVVFAILTLHIGLCGKDIVNSGFGGIIGFSYENHTTGGVLFSLISLPVVLPCKYTVSVIIFFLLTAIFGFLSIFPYLFDLTGERQKRSDDAPPEKEASPPSPSVRSVPVVERPAKPTVVPPPARPEPETSRQPGLLDGNDMSFEPIVLPPQKDNVFTGGGNKKPSGRSYLNFGEPYTPYKDADSPLKPIIRSRPENRTIRETVREDLNSSSYIAPRPLFDSDEDREPVGKVPPLPPNVAGRPVIPAADPIEKTKKERTDSDVPTVAEPVPYNPPPHSLLIPHVNKNFSPYVDNYDQLKDVFENKLKNFGLDVTLIDVYKGPTITFCELALSDNCSIKKVFNLRYDISRLLQSDTAKEINIVNQIPNTPHFGIEVPNAVKGIVSFKEVVESREYGEAKGDIVLALGKTNAGQIVIEDLALMPHALIAGQTGSGKSVCINVILANILYRYSPEEVKLILVDLKLVEMGNFTGLPHMLFKRPLNTVGEVINVIKWLRAETLRRYKILRSYEVRDLSEYRKKAVGGEILPRIVFIVDEANELMTDALGRRTIEDNLASLARMARAAGIHLIFATQNPVKEVITSEIQNNLNVKIAFAVGDYMHSMVIFKAPGAEKLLGNGDMIIKRGSAMSRAQCAYISTGEINAIADYIRENNKAEFDDALIDKILHGENGADDADDGTRPGKTSGEDADFKLLVRDTLAVFLKNNRVSISYAQRKLNRGFNTIAGVMEYLEEKGYVTVLANKQRALNLTKEQFFEMYPDAEKFDEE